MDNKNDDHSPGVIERLSAEYQLDLMALRNIDLTCVTDLDLNRLNIMCKKYGVKSKPNKNNYVDLIGDLSFIITDRNEKLVVEHVLERVREKDMNKKQRREKVPHEELPRSLRDG